MTELAIYAFPMTKDCDQENMALAFRSIDVAQHTATLLAKLFQGEAKMSGDGSQTVQYDDTVIIKRKLTKDEEKFIRNTFPFVSIYDRTPYHYNSAG